MSATELKLVKNPAEVQWMVKDSGFGLKERSVLIRGCQLFSENAFMAARILGPLEREMERLLAIEQRLKNQQGNAEWSRMRKGAEAEKAGIYQRIRVLAEQMSQLPAMQ